MVDQCEVDDEKGKDDQKSDYVLKSLPKQLNVLAEDIENFEEVQELKVVKRQCDHTKQRHDVVDLQ